ncbi:hypothetical protein GCM10010213_25700 [Microbacterium maritypicum]|uniref:Uncharacterized protein n=2 Tax=Microbacterium maritypicum TaxID=33918 RepID=A0A4Y4BAA3_MICMQ|nr:hypothetical protein MLI01_25870 [Microbacterium liquefaciens]GGV61703.1 hypothetical protein GCM10010213_25700 [Microbacterium liquefaciens]
MDSPDIIARHWGRGKLLLMTLTYERKVTADDEGTEWLYVDPVSKSSHRVDIDVVPEKAHRIRVQHLDRDMRGKSEWVPIRRAKVPWALREEYEKSVALWRAAEVHRPSTAYFEIALLLLDTYLQPEVAEMYGNGATGILVIRDRARLSRITRIETGELKAHPDTFEDGDVYAPWPTTLRVLKAVCRLDPQPAMTLLGQRRADETRFAQGIAQEGDPWWMQGARDGDKWAARIKHWHNLETEEIAFLRDLVDAEEPTLAEDFLKLREMYLDFVRLTPDAVARIRMIPAQRSQRVADTIEELAARPLPRSAELIGAEPPDAPLIDMRDRN